MNRLSIIADSAERARAIDRQIGGLFETRAYPRASLTRVEPTKFTVIDIDLTNGSHLPDLRQWLTGRPSDGKAIFAVKPGSMHQAMQALAIGATDVLEHPLGRKILLKTLLGDLDAMAGNPLPSPLSDSAGITSAVAALRSIFAAVVSGDPIQTKSVQAASAALVSSVESLGLARWIDVVRTHHSQTYQHCLLVTGVAVGFGCHLHFSSTDREKLAFAGLLHDLGKAAIPVAILEKPGPLNRGEISIMRNHPRLGFDWLQKTPGIDPAILDVVLHHHEYLDGSGYPEGLSGTQLSDLVRLVTIADIYGALIERRSYRGPMSGQAAYEVIEKMGPKLDADLVREFRVCALTTPKPKAR
jgi:HD-GYP domain-containing protein (c-di-GMP phosphodiesterase class II)